MPLIPDEFQTQTDVKTGPSAGLNEDASPAAFGQPIAQSLSYGGEIATKIHYDAVEAANQVAVNGALNQIDAAGQKALRDPQTGLLYQQTGAQAPLAQQKTMSDLQQQVGKVRAGLSNDQQRLTFDQSSRHITDTWAAHTDAYVGQQLEEHTKNVAVQTLALADQAVSNDPTVATERLAAVQGSVETTAKALHYTPGTDDYNLFVQSHMRDANTQIGKTAVQAYISQDQPTAAGRYLQQYGPTMDADVRLKLQEQVKGASVEQQGQSIAMDFLNGKPASATRDQIIAANTGSHISAQPAQTDTGAQIPGSRGLFDRATFNAQVENDPRLSGSPEAERLREAVERHGTAVIEQHQAAVNEQDHQNFQKIFNATEQTKGILNPDMAALRKTLPPELQEGIDRHVNELLKPAAEAQDAADKAKAAADKWIKTRVGDQSYGDWFQRAMEDSKFLQQTNSSQLYSRYHDVWSEEQYAHGIEMLGKAHKPDQFDPKAPGVEDNSDDPDQYAHQVGLSAGLDAGALGRFAPLASKALEDARDQNKDQPLTEKQKQEAVGPFLVHSVFVPNANRTWGEWLTGDQGGKIVPWDLLSPDERKRLSPEVRRAFASAYRPNGAGAPMDATDWETLTQQNKPQRK